MPRVNATKALFVNALTERHERSHLPKHGPRDEIPTLAFQLSSWSKMVKEERALWTKAAQIRDMERKRDELEKKIREYREQCPHPPQYTSFKYGSDGGGYERHTSYWKDMRCHMCGKVWQEDQ